MPIRPPAHLLGPLLLERDRLIVAVARTIELTFRAAEIGCVKPPGEVDRLVYFFAEGLPNIESQFNRILEAHGVRATLSGIFCHQTPRVIPEGQPAGRSGVCELGDILFVTTYGRPLYKRILGNAMLVQAKQDIPMIQGTLQEFLYTDAAGFAYVSPRTLAGQRRNLQECNHSLWYWGVGQSPFRWAGRESVTHGRCARHYPHVKPDWPFEIALVDLLCGITGRRWHAVRAEAQEAGWSRTVSDLVRVTANSALRRQNAHIVRDRETLRGEDAIRAISQAMGGSAPFLVRASLRKFLHKFDPELEAVGEKLEAESSSFDEDHFESQQRRRFLDNPKTAEAPPPVLGNVRMAATDDDDGGCSFIVIDIS